MLKAQEGRIPKEEEIYNLQIGLGESALIHEEKHFFDIAGYRVVEDSLTDEQVTDARQSVMNMEKTPPRHVGRMPHEQMCQLVNVIEGGGVVEDAMALPAVIDHVLEFIWGRQYRLVGSRAILLEPGAKIQLTPGGAAANRRFADYRCWGDGQFRCLMISCLIPLQDATYLAIPASHKANFPHPYKNYALEAIPPLVAVPIRQGSVVLYTESLSHAIQPPATGTGVWLLYQYGTSYMVNWPGCDPSSELLARSAADPEKHHLLLAPYYHPPGTYRKRE